MTTTNKIQNGSLYFNVSTNRVERAVGSINGRRLWTQYHKNTLKATPVRELRLAQSHEMEEYKAESASAPVVRISLPPIPQKV